MLQFSFIASLSLTIVSIIFVMSRIFRAPVLQINLTKDIFFRLIDLGECLFVNAVMVARNGPVLIEKAQLMLEKLDPPKKTYPLGILFMGEKVHGSNPIADHHFYTSSPLDFIPASTPKRVVYLCEQREYRDRVRAVMDEFSRITLERKQAILSRARAGVDEREGSEILAQLLQIVEEYTGKIMELVQIEEGRYSLKLTLTYSWKGFLIGSRRCSQDSSITFSVRSDVKDKLRTSLRQTLQVISANLLYDKQTIIVYPEYTPYEILEQ